MQVLKLPYESHQLMTLLSKLSMLISAVQNASITFDH